MSNCTHSLLEEPIQRPPNGSRQGIQKRASVAQTTEKATKLLGVDGIQHLGESAYLVSVRSHSSRGEIICLSEKASICRPNVPFAWRELQVAPVERRWKDSIMLLTCAAGSSSNEVASSRDAKIRASPCTTLLMTMTKPRRRSVGSLEHPQKLGQMIGSAEGGQGHRAWVGNDLVKCRVEIEDGGEPLPFAQ